MPVGLVPLFRIGDLWRDGVLHSKPDYELETFESVRVEGATLVKAGVNLDGRGFLLPAGEHPWHMRCTHSYCLKVDLPGSRRLIVPCMELARFYFGSSSKLLAKLFEPGLVREDLYADASFDDQTGHMSIVLAQGMTWNSAADIARICRDPNAWRAALTVGSSIQEASADAEDRRFPKARFPFSGTSTLTAAGRWLTFGSGGRSTFLVYNLRSCSHAFPFRSLKYEVKGGRPRVQTTQFVPKARSFKARSLQMLEEMLPGEDPSKNFARRNLRQQGAQRFPDLVPKSILRVSDLELQGPAQSGGGEPGPKASSVGESSSEKRVRPVELMVACSAADHQSKMPSFLTSVVNQLSQMHDRVQVRLLTQTDDGDWTVPVPTVVDDEGVIHDNLFVERNGGSDLRRVCAFELTHGKRSLRLIAIEADFGRAAILLCEQSDVWESLHQATLDFLGNKSRSVDQVIEQVTVALGAELSR